MLPFLILGVLLNNFILCHADPTDGFTPVPLTASNFELQKPYDIPLQERYSYVNGVHKLWLYATDKPHDPNSHTQLCTEIRIKGLDYSSGVWRFEGYGFVPNGTSGVTVSQIHGAAHDSSTIILRIYDGNMRYYNGDLIATGMYDKWFRLNLIHDVHEGTGTVFLVFKSIKQRIEEQVTCISNAEFMLHLEVLVTTWNPGGETSKYIKSEGEVIPIL